MTELCDGLTTRPLTTDDAQAVFEVIAAFTLGRTLQKRAVGVPAYFDRTSTDPAPATSQPKRSCATKVHLHHRRLLGLARRSTGIEPSGVRSEPARIALTSAASVVPAKLGDVISAASIADCRRVGDGCLSLVIDSTQHPNRVRHHRIRPTLQTRHRSCLSTGGSPQRGM